MILTVKKIHKAILRERCPRPQIRPGFAKKKRPANITPNIARSALSGDTTDVTSVTDRCIFIKWP